MSTSLLAMGVAGLAIIGLVVNVAGISLFLGAVEFLFGKGKLKILKSTKGSNGFAFALEWNDGKEPCKFDRVNVRLFNPFGKPTQIEASKDFEAKATSFAIDLELAPNFEKILNAQGIENATVQIELYASKEGTCYQYEYKANRFKELLLDAPATADVYGKKFVKKVSPSLAEYGVVPQKSMIADTVPGKGPQLKIATNPSFAGEFQGAGSADAGAAASGATLAPFAVTKVWIEPGCIVCNACENIYPEVFEVKSDTCIIRPGAPLDLGLKIKEAAEACPVEVIKFTKAG
jgi:ferredoxin